MTDAKIPLSYGKEYDNPEERKNFLADNADDIEEMCYTKRFDSDTLLKKKDKYIFATSKVSDIEEQIKEFRDEKKAELKPYKEEATKLLSEIKQKGCTVTEKCFKFVDRDTRMVGYYNSEGDLVSSRPATRDELPANVFSLQRDAKEA